MLSSQLSAQLFSKQFAWGILCDRFPLSRHTPSPQLKVEVWWKRVYVHLPASLINNGISTFLSFWDFIDAFCDRSYGKSYRCQVFLEKTQGKTQYFTVTSYQGPEVLPHRVSLHRYGASCTCMLFRCIGNRVRNEINDYYQLMKQSRFFNGQPVCHHIHAALMKIGYGCLQDYIEDCRT